MRWVRRAELRERWRKRAGSSVVGSAVAGVAGSLVGWVVCIRLGGMAAEVPSLADTDVSRSHLRAVGIVGSSRMAGSLVD